MKKTLLQEVRAMNKIAGTQLTKEQEITLIRERLEQLNELEFGTQKAFDSYQKQHDLRGDTKVTVAGKKMSVSQAAKQSKDPAIKGTSVFGKKKKSGEDEFDKLRRSGEYPPWMFNDDIPSPYEIDYNKGKLDPVPKPKSGSSLEGWQLSNDGGAIKPKDGDDWEKLRQKISINKLHGTKKATDATNKFLEKRKYPFRVTDVQKLNNMGGLKYNIK